MERRCRIPRASARPALARNLPEVGEISAAFLVWVGVAFLAAACWGAVAILGGMVFLRERLGVRLALGAAVTLAGVFLATLAHMH